MMQTGVEGFGGGGYRAEGEALRAPDPAKHERGYGFDRSTHF